jgi:hypothetical protein
MIGVIVDTGEGNLGLFLEDINYTLLCGWGEDPRRPHLEILKEETGIPTPINLGAQFQTLPIPDFSKHSTVLDKAKDLIFGDRVNDYGKTSDSFKNICAGWKIIFEPGFTPERVGLAMAWLKICRASNDNCEKEDSLVDCCGYIACVEKVKAGI